MSSTDSKEKQSAKRVVQPQKQKLLTRMRRIEGQIRGVANMIEEDRYCIDILTQIAALRSALDAVSLNLLEDHAKHCVRHAIQEGDDGAIDELMMVIKRLKK